ncbi:MAG: TolC family protein [Spirochaetes bacterium]|nr:TolC family protein [Spirochaetota bacterium]
MAIQNHPEIKASDEDTNIAQANYAMAKSRNSPNINLEMKTVESQFVDQDGRVVKPKNGVVSIPGQDTAIGLFVGPTLIYNLIDPQRSEAIDSARSAIDLAKMKAFKVKSDIVLNVKKNYYYYLFARENRAKREQLVDKFQSKLQKAKLLVKNGQRPGLDVSKAEVDLADARLEYEKAKNYESVIKSELLSSMGIMDEDIEFSPVMVDKLPELRFDLKKLYQLSEGNNPDIKISQMTKDINQLNVSMARSAHYPSVDFLGALGMKNTKLFNDWENPYKYPESYQEKLKGENWEKSINLGISAKLNLWSGGGIDAKVDSKIAEFNKSKYLEREILIKVRTSIKNYFQTINEYKKQIDLSLLVMDNSQKHLRLAQKSYENGISTQLELHDAEMTLLKSELNYIKAGYDYLIILARLSNIVGLGEEYICKK